MRLSRRCWRRGRELPNLLAVLKRGKEKEAPVEESTPADASVQAFREALTKSVMISRERLEEVVEDAVRRGRMTRSDAEELVSRIVVRGREQAGELLEQVVGPPRREVTRAARRARDRANQPLRRFDRARRRARIGRFPITAYDQLTVPQINDRLRELTQAELRKVRDYEVRKRNRKSVLQAVDRKLDSE